VSFFDSGRSASLVDVSAVLDATFTELLGELVGAGVLVSVGRSRDGGALSVTVTSGGQYRREWVRSDEECHAFLKEAVAALAGDVTVPPTSQRARRAR